MKPRDIFTIVVKTLGLIALLQGALSLFDGVMILTDLANTSHSTPKYWAVRGLGQGFVGLLLLRGSEKFVRFGFLDSNPEDTIPEDGDSGTLEDRFFRTPLVDMGLREPRFKGVKIPIKEQGLPFEGITDQFLENAEDYHRKFGSSAHGLFLFRRAFKTFGIPLKDRLNILDIGTGSGVNSVVPLLEIFPKATIIATDLSPNLLKMLHDHIERQNLSKQVLCVCTSAMRDYFKSESFDLVVGASILHHLLDPGLALDAACRVLRPGGAAIFFEPFENGNAILRHGLELVKAENERRGNVLDPRVLKHAQAIITDLAFRMGRDKSHPHFKNMDDKWLFTPAYFNEMGKKAGFRTVQIISNHEPATQFVDSTRVTLRLGSGLEPDALPDWAWDIFKNLDSLFSDDLKRDLIIAGTVFMKK